MQQAFPPEPEPLPKLKPSKRHSETDYSLYQPRTMLIMKNAASMKPIPAVLDKYQGPSFLRWQFDVHLKESRYEAWLDDLDAMDEKPSFHPRTPKKQNFRARCNCCSSTPWCR